jgi:hypothetical protein
MGRHMLEGIQYCRWIMASFVYQDPAGFPAYACDDRGGACAFEAKTVRAAVVARRKQHAVTFPAHIAARHIRFITAF